MAVVTKCWKCQTQFWLPDALHSAARASADISFFCPYGHSAHFPEGETEEDKLRRERDRLKQDAARLEDEKRQWMSTANAQLERAQKAEAATAKLKKRSEAGVCSCCNRTFLNMQRHMKSKHPNVVQLEKKSA